MMKFFSQLAELTNIDVSNIDKTLLSAEISNLDTTMQTYVFLIINHYAVVTSVTDLGAVPMGTKGYKFNANLLPEDLCILLYKFVKFVTRP